MVACYLAPEALGSDKGFFARLLMGRFFAL